MKLFKHITLCVLLCVSIEGYSQYSYVDMKMCQLLFSNLTDTIIDTEETDVILFEFRKDEMLTGIVLKDSLIGYFSRFDAEMTNVYHDPKITLLSNNLIEILNDKNIEVLFENYDLELMNRIQLGLNIYISTQGRVKKININKTNYHDEFYKKVNSAFLKLISQIYDKEYTIQDVIDIPKDVK